MKSPLFAAAILGLATYAQAQTLTVIAPDYFGSEWGPGPAIKEGFEARCGTCTLNFRTGDVMSRLQLEGARLDGDVVIGLNTDTTLRARETGLFVPHGQPLAALTLPIDWADDTFLPFNWGYNAWVYDKTRVKNPPTSFADLITREDISLIWQDPRSSSAGLALLLWVDQLYGEDAADVWAALSERTVTVTAGWSEAYGLFTEGEADMVLSYATSPAYHIVAEEDDSKAAAIFSEGHYLTAEVAGVLSGTENPGLAADFMAYILSPEFQQMIAYGNWSYPSALPREDWPEVMRDLPYPDTALFYGETQAEERRVPALDLWLEGMTR
ncbi:thiamine ABC transporter substrate-binding protein [Roseinatronobacter sp.]|uniref:thiamine ABC transporter substrate-binding protein n=1 Tax=Roseinatronobacter sp. TaxID=1945755 RepID=UPI0025F86C62|nr:thiamine ABC transporter substrate-binding protein [Roseibaca sp.]